MKIQKILLVFFVASCAFGLEVRPDSTFFTLSGRQKFSTIMDTVTLYNTTDSRIEIDTVSIKFLNGDSTDFILGKGCNPTDPLNYGCYLYSGWLYGSTNISLGYIKDSLFVLQNAASGPINCAIPPHDSLLFSVRAIFNCWACDRGPGFPATTEFLYSFITADGQRATFFLSLYQATNVSHIQIPRHYQPAGRLGPLYNLRGQKMNDGSPIGILIRNNKTYFRLDWNARKLNGN